MWGKKGTEISVARTGGGVDSDIKPSRSVARTHGRGGYGKRGQGPRQRGGETTVRARGRRRKRKGALKSNRREGGQGGKRTNYQLLWKGLTAGRGTKGRNYEGMGESVGSRGSPLKASGQGRKG